MRQEIMKSLLAEVVVVWVISVKFFSRYRHYVSTCLEPYTDVEVVKYAILSGCTQAPKTLSILLFIGLDSAPLRVYEW